MANARHGTRNSRIRTVHFRGIRKKRALPAEERRLPESKDAIQEELLASLIAGTLPDKERAEVARYLAENADAREVLRMANEAMRSEKPGYSP